MQSKQISDYIWLGLQWRYLQDQAEGRSIHGKDLVLANIEGVFSRLERFGLHVTLRAASDLSILKAELAKTPDGAKLTAQQALTLTKSLEILQRTLQAECAGNIAYIVTDKRLNTEKLLNHPEKLFAPGVFDALPGVARLDFREAAMCIAFERSTAAAFHLLRGTEDVLRTFYRSLIKRNRLAPAMWGPMVEALRKRKTPPPPELLGVLDHLRRSFRNPTQHPEKVYDIQEAQDLFSLCVDATNRMVGLKGWQSDA